MPKNAARLTTDGHTMQAHHAAVHCWQTVSTRPVKQDIRMYIIYIHIYICIVYTYIIHNALWYSGKDHDDNSSVDSSLTLTMKCGHLQILNRIPSHHPMVFLSSFVAQKNKRQTELPSNGALSDIGEPRVVFISWSKPSSLLWGSTTVCLLLMQNDVYFFMVISTLKFRKWNFTSLKWGCSMTLTYLHNIYI